MVYDAHLFILQIHASSVETGWWGEMACFIEGFHKSEVQDVTEFSSG
jgi:hypothetical protein